MNYLALFAACALFGGVVREAAGQDYEPRVFTNAVGATLPYRWLSPASAEAGRKYPLVLFLHGAGERGNNNSAQLIHGTKLYLEPANRAKFPCFVVAPQCPANQQWVDMPWGGDKGTQPAKPSAPMQLVLELLDTLPKGLPVDTDRIYVTGLSMGGYGTWDLVTRFPDRFAAGAPVCGGGDETVAARAAKVPLWAFHSDDDGVVKVSRTRTMLAGMRAAGGQPKYFEYFGLGHGSWAKAYSEPELLPWMFAQRRGQPDTFQLQTKPPELPAVAKLPETDAGLPGAGPLRRYDWFRNLWRQKRLAWAGRVQQDKGAVVFLGDSITQGWGDNLGNSFPGLKVANRGISGDTTRGMLYRLKEDVLDLSPKAVVLLAGTNDIEEKATPEVIAGNVKLLLAALQAHNPTMPVVLCQVMPSHASKSRSKETITRLNELLAALAKGNPQVTLVDTWTPFADASGDAKKEEFPDLLHPNAAGYKKWAEALKPVLSQLKLTAP
ncbi:MAG: hypothetical protein RL514_1091 [Verrucomicrobiota bacterium]|jgi:lysophospholipase L1-like esterase/poly(3-hydroxybutyrate) depolymerase